MRVSTDGERAPTGMPLTTPAATGLILASGRVSSSNAWIFYVFLGLAVVIGIGLIARFVLGRPADKRGSTPKSNDRPQR